MKNYAEVPMNVVLVPQGWTICFATDSDVDVGVGLPKLINDTYHLEKKLSGESYDTGTSHIVGNVAMLIVKESCYDRADEDYLRSALEDLREKCESNGYDRIAMPKICCGNNGMKWKVIKKMIKETFKGSDVFVMICV